MQHSAIQLSYGSGGREMGELIKFIRECLSYTGGWECTDEDSAVYKTPPNRVCFTKSLEKSKHISLAFTTDAFVVTPIFFKGGNIGELAFNGTLNDLLVQGAKPLGISLALVLEEGLRLDELEKILKSIGALSRQTKVPIATGDTKVVGKGVLDKIMITTAGVGIVEDVITDRGLKLGDKIIASGTLGDHGAAIIAHRFGYKTDLKSDTKPLVREIEATKKYLTSAKDPTRGGIASVLNEMAEKSCVKIVLYEEKVPIKKETDAISKLLGINRYSFASEGRFVAGVEKKNAEKVMNELKKFNNSAIIMGEVMEGRGVYIKNKLGMKKLEMAEGLLIPRIC